MGYLLLDPLSKRKVDLTNLTPPSRFVLWIFAEKGDNNTLLSYPGTPLLMEHTGLSERQVQRCVHELRSRGLLELVENRGGKRRWATYRVRVGVEPRTVPAESQARLAELGLGAGAEADPATAAE